MRFNKCLVIVNSAGTNVQKAMNLSGQLREYFSDEQIELIEISGLDELKQTRLIAKRVSKLNEKSIICVAGGDGTVSHVVNVLLTDARVPASAKKAVILPLWGGNANDFAYMVNGNGADLTLKQLLNGRVVAVRPLEVMVKQSGRARTKLAICYASFGISAYTSELLNKPGYRQMKVYNYTGSRQAVELATALKAFLGSKAFTAEISGREASLYDLIMVNGPRMAKLNRFPIKITDRSFVEMSISSKLTGFFHYVSHALNWRPARVSKTERSLVVHDSIWAQLDGEVSRIPKQTAITIKINEKPFYVLSTKLK